MVALTVSLLAFIDFLREARGFLDGMVTGGSLVGVEVGVELGFQDSSKSLSY